MLRFAEPDRADTYIIFIKRDSHVTILRWRQIPTSIWSRRRWF